MQVIPMGRSPFVFWEELVFVEASLLAVAETAHLAALVTEHLERFEVIWGQELKSRRTQIQARALGRIRDLLLDGGIRALHNAALFLVSQNRSDKSFAVLFPEDLRATIRFALKRQIEVADTIVQRLGLDIFADTLRAPHSDNLKALISQGQQALAQRDQAELTRLQSRLNMTDWKQDANAIRTAIHGRLTELAAQKRYPNDWPEAFFDFTHADPIPPEAPSNPTPPDPDPTLGQ